MGQRTRSVNEKVEHTYGGLLSLPRHISTWEMYTSPARKRVLAEIDALAEAPRLQPNFYHVAALTGWPAHVVERFVQGAMERGAHVWGDARCTFVAGGIGAFWRGMVAMRSSDAPLGSHELVRDLARSLSGDGIRSSSAIRVSAADMEWGRHVLPIGRRSVIMGILNVTPDSFSDGGLYAQAEQAVARGLELVEQGADVIDVGGESTRPGAMPVAEGEELARVLPVVESLADKVTVPISIDTYKARVAARALAAGAAIVNDISALRFDKDMADVVAHFGVPVILMHMLGTPRDMQRNPVYKDVVTDVLDFLDDAIARALQAGIDRRLIMVDPGIGFGKTYAHNVTLLRNVRALQLLGCPIVIGTSRKAMLGRILHVDAQERDIGTGATVAHALANGAAMVRVHDVAISAQVGDVTDALAGRSVRPRVFLGLGSNMGDPPALLAEAVRRIDGLPRTRVVQKSALYRTEPVGHVKQPWFFNQVIEIETGLHPARLLRETQKIELDLGRDRPDQRQHWGPRPIDIDLLLYGEELISRPDLLVPHVESHRRRFVLQPLVDIAPDVRWRGRTASEHLAALPPGQPVSRWTPETVFGQ